MATPPSIFNDVIGPVMRGPSSSHCAAALRIGRLARDLMDGRIERVRMEFDRRGSLAHTHASQGSDMGIFGGLLGWEATDERLLESAAAVERSGIRIDIEIGDYPDPHPNTYRLTLANSRETHRMIALSTGGGMIEVIEVDRLPRHGDVFAGGQKHRATQLFGDVEGMDRESEAIVHIGGRQHHHRQSAAAAPAQWPRPAPCRR